MLERRCIASGQTKSAEELIRFVRAPDGAVVPDLAQKLPGRGCWVSLDQTALKKACEKGLFKRHIDATAPAYEVLLAQLVKLLGHRFQQSLSLARRAGLAIGGGGRLASYEMMEGMIIANDASARESKAHVRRLMPEWVHEGFDATVLGPAFGRESLAYIGILPDPNGTGGGLSVRLKHDIDRFAAFLPPLGCQEGRDGCITQASANRALSDSEDNDKAPA